MYFTKRWIPCADVKINEDFAEETTYVCTTCASKVEYHHYPFTFYLREEMHVWKTYLQNVKANDKIYTPVILNCAKYFTNFLLLEHLFGANKASPRHDATPTTENIYGREWRLKHMRLTEVSRGKMSY